MSAFSGNVALVIRGGKPSRDEEGTVWAGEYPKPEEAFRYRVGSAHNFSVMLRRAQILSSRAIWEAGVDFFAFDKPYVERLRSCDPATEHHFFVYFDKLLQIKLRARAIGFDKVEDLKQDTFVRVITAVRKDGGVRQPERFGAFVNSVCNNVLLEYYRALRKNQQMDGTQEEIPSKVLDLKGMMVSKRCSEQVRKILSGLPARDCELLREVFLEEKDKDTVCRDIGVDRNYLRLLLHRAKNKFKAVYESQGWRVRREFPHEKFGDAMFEKTATSATVGGE